MKVVLFCGGMGMRLREYSENTPKPMVPIGYRPILWNIMKYYAYYGHKDFILCLGYKADMFKNYFVNYDEFVSNDFVYSGNTREIQLLNSDIHDWTITFVDTGVTSNIGQRLKLIEPYLEGEEVFLANYSDGLTDLPLPDMVDHFVRHNRVASFLSYQPSKSFHVATIGENDLVSSISQISQAGLWINAGYFILRREIFDYLHFGEELVEEPFQRLIEERQLVSYPYKGFWATMDTFKEKQYLDDLYAKGNPPWEVWNHPKKLIPHLY